MTRHTFVVQVHSDGLSTLENLSTHERVRVTDLAAVGPQIEQWLERLASPAVPQAGGVDNDA
jgi:hypothetical protein